ncbi:MAG: AraC family transcriptional regulator [Verrucomicrobiales bacterium]|nr:AraC family transcriptional regulator [Verrucomicrobiales bacterium]
MADLFPDNEFLTNLWATPTEWQRDLFYCAVRAGHLRAGVTHRIERQAYPGHEWILCLSGAGWVKIQGRQHAVRRGDLVWVNCHRPHSYGAAPDNPWEVYWIRAEGRDLERFEAMLSCASRPVLELANVNEAALPFERVFRHMNGTRPSDAAACHAAMAELVALSFAARLNDPEGLRPDIPDAVRQAVQHMRLYYSKPLRVKDLADLTGLSESTLGRQFRTAMGTSPIHWLRHWRINQAKRRLLESDAPIKEVASLAGYADQFFFSKDFKRMTGLTPSQFRLDERK